MNEIWKDIDGYEGLYQVSNLGRVKSLAKMAGRSLRRELFLKQQTGTNGYLQVILYKNNKSKCFWVHRLVAQTFIPNPENKPQVNHINGVKIDNVVENLEWNTISENLKHAYVTGLSHSNKAKRVFCSELNKTFQSAIEASKYLNLSRNSVSQAIRRHQKCGGYTWRYVG